MSDACARLVRRHDPDRFLTALFAPADKRPLLLVLYAFNHELARAREAVSVPMLALIRLQWWREVVDGARRQHEVAGPLADGIAPGLFEPARLRTMIDAREMEVEPEIPTRAAFLAYVSGTAGGLAVAAGALLGAPEPEALRPYGTAYGIAGVLRSARLLARQGRCLLPADVLAEHGLSPDALIAAPDEPGLGAVLRRLAEDARALLRGAPPAPRLALAAALPAVLASRDLARIDGPVRPRGLSDKLAVVLAAARGRAR